MDTSPERGVFLEPMAVIVHGLLHANIKPGDTVVVQGAGPIGLLNIAAAKVCGASRIIAIGRRNKKRLELAKMMGADYTLCIADTPDIADRIKFVTEKSINRVGADVVFNTAGTPEAFHESLQYVRDSGTMVELGNFVDEGTTQFNPCKDLLEKGIKIIGSFDNEAEHFVRALPLITDVRLPLEKLITHRLPLSKVPDIIDAIHSKGGIYNGTDVVKAVIDPTL